MEHSIWQLTRFMQQENGINKREEWELFSIKKELET